MTSDDNKIRFRDLLRGALRGLPDTLVIGRGLAGLLMLSRERPASIGLLLQKLAKKTPQRIALTFEGQRWTYAEFNAWANRCAAEFRSHGIGPGEVVGILMENRPEVLACVAGAVKLGATAAMFNHNQRADALAHSIRITDPKLMLVGVECADAMASLGPLPRKRPDRHYLWLGAGKLPAGYQRFATTPSGPNAADPPETQAILPGAAAFYIFTSGTTGMPKASVMTHYRWLRGMAGLGQMSLRLHADDVLYCALPLYHNNALTVSWGAALGAGCTLALGRKFSASRFWDEIRAADATAFCYIGELCRYLLNRPESSGDRDHRVRAIVGNGLRPELWERFQTRFGIERIGEFYGASESTLAFVNAFGVSRTAGFCPLPYAVVEFDAEDETPRRGAGRFMQKVPSNGVGLLITEVAERTPFDGYVNRTAGDPKSDRKVNRNTDDLESNEAKLLRDVFKRGDCWFNTGDLVRDQGWRHIQFVDRVGDTFRWKGENVATTEVEAALNACAGVEQAVAYGVQLTAADGRAGMAALTWCAGQFDGAAIAKQLRQSLPAYAVPVFIRLRAEQTTTSTFKYLKVDLKREGFDPHRIDDPVFVLTADASAYTRLTAAVFDSIERGELRL